MESKEKVRDNKSKLIKIEIVMEYSDKFRRIEIVIKGKIIV